MLRILLVLFAACFAALVAAIAYLPPWGVLLVMAGLFAVLLGAAWYVKQTFLTSLFAIPFRAKGAVLRRARAEVHSVEAVAGPWRGAEPEDSAPCDFYRIDVTITPRFNPGPFKFWEPGELVLVPANVRVGGLDALPDGCPLHALEVFEGGRFGADEGTKYFGPRRLRFTVGVPREGGRSKPKTLSFLYYFSKFGTVTLPPARDDPTDLGGRPGERTRS